MPNLVIPPLPRLIGLTGEAGCGKDLTGALLSMWGYQPFSLGNLVREEITSITRQIKSHTAAPVTAEVLDALSALSPTCLIRQGFQRSLRSPDVLYTKPTPPPIRALLQWWGTDFRRLQDPDYWLKRLPIPLPPQLVITDVRFPNEANYIRSRNGLLWLIIRDDHDRRYRLTGKLRDHISESGLDPSLITRRIHNITDQSSFASHIRLALQEPSTGVL